MNWSGGKDCSMALLRLKETNNWPALLLTTANHTTQRVSMHGVRNELIREQAFSLGVPLRTIFLPQPCSMDDYNALMKNTVVSLKNEGYSHAAFGDIFLDDLRAFRDAKLGEEGMQTLYPVWKEDTATLGLHFIRSGFKAIVVCTSSRLLTADFCGRVYDENFLADLPPGVDPCGENGEFHTFVYDGPMFKQPVAIAKGVKEYHTYPAPAEDKTEAGFWYQELLSC